MVSANTVDESSKAKGEAPTAAHGGRTGHAFGCPDRSTDVVTHPRRYRASGASVRAVAAPEPLMASLQAHLAAGLRGPRSVTYGLRCARMVAAA